MSATTWFRVAAVLLFLFAGGHTFGFLKFRAPNPEGRAVYESMNTVTMPTRGGNMTYGGVYRGFGLYVTVYLLFAAFLAWHLATMAATNPGAIGALGWVFFAVQIASLVLSWLYFNPIPTVFSGLVAICVAAGAWKAGAAG